MEPATFSLNAIDSNGSAYSIMEHASPQKAIGYLCQQKTDCDKNVVVIKVRTDEGRTITLRIIDGPRGGSIMADVEG